MKKKEPTRRPKAKAGKTARRAPAPAPTPPVERRPPSQKASSSFPIVGIGSSAGGLEALELFLRNVPPRSGIAYVIVQHLDPTHKGAMVELLQRVTKMPVVEVQDRQAVAPDCVYVIPPNKDMSILHGVLHLLPQPSPRGLNLPIDFFLRSLAADRGDRSIGVVLSGMGSDGTAGLGAIKEKAGATFVQSLSTAKFSGMPRSAIEADFADVVADAEDLPARILAYLRHTPYLGQPEAPLEEKHLSALEKILILLRNHTGSDFTLYKRSTIYRRIERRMGLYQIDQIGSYVRYLRENPRELDLLFKELLIGVTSFFRDGAVWDFLAKHVLPDLLTARSPNAVVRGWVPGCSTGEEAYSLAIALSEAIAAAGTNATFQIFATDVDHDAIERARQGVYPSNIAADVSPERLRRYFSQDERGYRVRKEIREAVVFAPQNLIMEPPFTKLDVVSCRNLLIYLSPELQKKIIPLFHYALNPGGVLFLGNAETVGPYSGLFSSLDGKTRLYRRLETPPGTPPVDFPPTFIAVSHSGASGSSVDPGELATGAPLSLPTVADRLILQRYAPSAILATEKGDILYISGHTGKYLEPAAGKANLNVFAMAREGLRYELSAAFGAAMRDEGAVTVRAVKVTTDGQPQSVDLTVQRLVEPKELRGTVMIVITDVPTPAPAAAATKGRRPAASPRLTEVERELQRSREEIQTTREEMQTSQEELKSTNEELQSTNEELQSTNEELTTSKEEMQSMNEELQTVNHELQSKVDELSRSNNDMKNLLNSTDIATLFLDGDLHVRRFTTQTSKLIKLIPADAGRPITDLATELDYPNLAADAREVLRSLVFKEKFVATRDGRWFNVRILPYRTLENVIDGVVITFTDATASKVLEFMLRDQAEQLKQMTESLPNLVWRCRPDGACDYVSRRWLEYTGVSEVEQLGFGWLDQVHAEDRERVRDQWRKAVRTGVELDTEYRLRHKSGSHGWFKASFVPIRDGEGTLRNWYCSCTEVDELKRVAERLASALDGIDEAFVGTDDKLVVTDVNDVAESLFDRKRADVVGKRLFEAYPASVVPEDEVLRAVRPKRPLAYAAEVTKEGREVAIQVRVFPRPGGVSMFSRRMEGDGKPRPSEDG